MMEERGLDGDSERFVGSMGPTRVFGVGGRLR